MAMDEQQTLLGGTGRSQLSVTIVEMASGSPQPSPLSDRSSQQLLESTATGETVVSSTQGIVFIKDDIAHAQNLQLYLTSPY